MVEKIVIIVANYFTYRDYKRYGVEILESNNFLVEIWDLSIVLSPKTIFEIKKTSSKDFSKEVKRYVKMSEVLRSVKAEKKETFFITTIIYNYKTIFLFKYIGKYGFEYGATGPYTFNYAPKLFSSSSQLSIFNRKFSDLFKGLINKILCRKRLMRILGVNYAKVFFAAGGSEVFAEGPIVGNNTLLIKGPSSDYDSLRDTENLSQDYILFLDQYLPFHPDFKTSQHKNNLSVDQYYNELKKTFSQIENLTNLKVLIAAHPKAYYHDKQHLFGKRKIYHNVNSSQLAKNAKLILMHYSMSISMAVLLNKPILFLSSDTFKNSFSGICTNNLAKWFETKPINMSKKITHLETLYAKPSVYPKYKDAYLKSPSSSDELFWQQVANYIKGNN
jgi:hypothetical protein